MNIKYSWEVCFLNRFYVNKNVYDHYIHLQVYGIA